MVNISIQGERVIFEPQGLDKLWAMKTRVEVDRRNIRDVRIDSEIARNWWQGWRLPGTHLPGVIIAGTFYKNGKKIFWDVHKSANAIVIDLENEEYDRIVVETDDADETVEMLHSVSTVS